MTEELKNPTSNNERKLLALVEKYRKSVCFGKIQIELTIQNNKIKVVQIGSVKETKIFD